MDKREETIKLVTEANKISLDILRNEIKEEIHLEFLKYRNSITTRDKWCCINMQSFALKVWHINSPQKTDDGFGMTYQYRGMNVIYCPFCGIKL